MAPQTGVLAPRRRGVLEAHREMQAPRTHACRQVVQPALLDRDAQAGIVAQDSGDRHWDDGRQGAGEGADAQLTPVLRRPVRQLPIREAQTLGDDVGMREQILARGRDPQLTAPALSRRVPTCRSRAATCCETADCVSDSDSAARENEPCCATSRKVSSRRGSSISRAYALVDSLFEVNAPVADPLAMDTRELSTTDGIATSALGLGCWAIGGPFGPEGFAAGWGDVDDDESVAAIRRGLELGVTFFDTADVYGTGHSETVLGRALGGERDDVVIATKFGNTFDEGTGRMLGTDASPAYIRRACEASLRRLGTDRIDLYQCHLGDLEPRRRRRGRRHARGAARRRADPRLRLEPRRRRARRPLGRP